MGGWGAVGRALVAVGATVLLAIVASGCSGVGPSQPPAPDDRDGPAAGTSVRIDRVVDGDTLVLQGGDRVRLAIVDAPEVGACAGAEATAFAEAWVADHGPQVELRRPAPPLVDPYDRRLGEVVSPAGRSLNVDLAAAGFGRVDERYAEEDPDLAARLRAAQGPAQQAGSGLWACAPSTDRTSTDPTSTDPTDPGPAAENPPRAALPVQPEPTPPQPDVAAACDQAYPTLCLPPGGVDLDCGDIPDRRFPVRPPDPHRFDGDGNGIGCERIATEA